MPENGFYKRAARDYKRYSETLIKYNSGLSSVVSERNKLNIPCGKAKIKYPGTYLILDLSGWVLI